MNKENLLKNSKSCFLVGIKGVGMTALAQILKGKGKKVTGSDTTEYFFTNDVLEKLKIPFIEGFDSSNVSSDIGLIIHSTAFLPNEHPELKEAKKKKIPIIPYPEAVSYLFNSSLGIAISGTHGKTTTSAMIAHGLKELGFDPTALIGSKVSGWETNARVGKSSFFVIEADEHQDKLRFYDPWSLILTNVDYDHPDFYPTEEAYFQSYYRWFNKWNNLRFNFSKIAILNGDDKKIKKLPLNSSSSSTQWIVNYGKEKGNSWRIKENGFSKNGQKIIMEIQFLPNSLPFEFNQKIKASFPTSLLGQHNAYNFAAASAFLAYFLLNSYKICSGNNHFEKLNFCSRNKKVAKWQRNGKFKNKKEKFIWVLELISLVMNSLKEFEGTERRLQLKGMIKKTIVYDDYAHHPTEIKATLEAVKEAFPDFKVLVIFHPHTFTRTNAFLSDFAKALSIADEIDLLEIYGSARETKGNVSSKDICSLIPKRKKTSFFATQKDCIKFMEKYDFNKPTILLTMGAGDVWKVGEALLKQYK